jgi:ferritin-like metal-binding protein YciE
MENHLVKAIPKMAAAAGNKELKQALKDHLKVTRDHASRLEEIFGILNEKVIAKKCDACEGLTMSGEHVIENTIAGTSARDVGIIMSALKVENFEITTYKGLIQVATSLGKTNVADLLQENLDEEEEASDLLTELSQTSIEEPA